MSSLPHEIWGEIISNFDYVEDIIAFESISKYHRDLSYEHVTTINHKDINLQDIVLKKPYINITDEWYFYIPVYIKIDNKKFRSPNPTWLKKHKNIHTLGFPILVECDTSFIHLLDTFSKLNEFVVLNYTVVDRNGLCDSTMTIDQMADIIVNKQRICRNVYLECASSFNNCYQIGIYKDMYHVSSFDCIDECLTSILKLSQHRQYIHLFTSIDIFEEEDVSNCIHILNSLPAKINMIDLKVHLHTDNCAIINTIPQNVNGKSVKLNI